MSRNAISLGEIICPAVVKRAGQRELPILSMTMRGGLVDQGEKFKKRIASADTSTYKVVIRGQLVVGFPIDEGVLSFQDRYDEAMVSPAYEIWNTTGSVEVEAQYLERYLRSPRAIAYYRSKLRGTTARRRSLPRDAFLGLPVLLPRIGEQRRITQILDTVDMLRVKRRKAVALLDVLAQSIFIDMFGDPARNPLGWPVKQIGDLIDSASYGTSEKAKADGDLPVLRMNNITASGDIDLRDLKYMNGSTVDDRYLVRSGDVLFNRTNSPDLVGKTAIYRGVAPLAYAGYLVRVRVNPKNHPEYIAAFLNTRYAKRVLRSMCKSIIGMANINAREMQKINIAEPPTVLQQDFAARISVVQKIKGVHQAHLAELDSLFASLQYRAFRGELGDSSAD